MLLDAHFLNDKLETAVHEAGHAVLAFYVGATITSATIETQGTLGGLVTYTHTTGGCVQDAIVAAGYVACVLYDGKYDMASENRRQRHSEEAAGDWANLKGDAHTALVHATGILELEENWYKVEALAVALLLNHTLTESQVGHVLRNASAEVPAVAVPTGWADVPDWAATNDI